MQLDFSPEEEAFRLEVRAFVTANLPTDIRDRVRGGVHLRKEDYIGWMKILASRGWLASGWPEEAGGTGWSATQRHIFEEEATAAGAPAVLPTGLQMVGPVLLAFGTEEQRQRFLPPIRNADEIWTQGYSEPGAGSDLASLRTAAARDGDSYVVNGSKIWTSKAHWADWIFALVRTSTGKRNQEGISVLLIDAKSPGVSMRPIHLLDGAHYFNQVFFDDVRVPVANLVGEEGAGWNIAKYLLEHERSGASAEIAPAFQRLERAEAAIGHAGLADDDPLELRRASAAIELMTAHTLSLRLLAAARADKAVGAQASILKIRGTEANQDITELGMQALGPYAAPFSVDVFLDGWNEPPVGPEDANGLVATFLECRKMSIWGGTNEIQRNIIAKSFLGL